MSAVRIFDTKLANRRWARDARVLVEMTLEVEGEVFARRAQDRDILPCGRAAFIDAASNAEAVRELRQDQAEKVEAA
jgi:hypothetical protein